MACLTEPGEFLQPVEHHGQPSLQKCALDLSDVPIEDQQWEPSAGKGSREKCNRGRVMLGAGFRRSVDNGKHAVATGRVGHWLAIVEQLVPGKEADAGPI